MEKQEIKRQKNDSTLSKLGDRYQHYIALLECFKMKASEKIQIEIQGDVTLISDDSRSFQMEIKHHIDEQNLSDRNTDFWNTVSNWVKNYNESIAFNQLIFFTTSNILATSIYYDWNSKSKDEKYKTLFDVGVENKAREESFRKYYKEVFNSSTSETKLGKIFEKINIQCYQPKISEITPLFSQYVTPIPDCNKDDYISALLGLILKCVNVPPHKWEITYDDFQKFAQDLASAYTGNQNRPLPSEFETSTISEVEKDTAKSKLFVKELERISYERIIHKAISDYWKATKTVARYFSDNISHTANLNAYRTDLAEQMFYAKEQMLNGNQLSTRSDEIECSKSLCSLVLGWQAKDFAGITGNRMFFKNGIIHNIVDDEEFTWDVGDENEH